MAPDVDAKNNAVHIHVVVDVCATIPDSTSSRQWPHLDCCLWQQWSCCIRSLHALMHNKHYLTDIPRLHDIQQRFQFAAVPVSKEFTTT
jgi:hypothetical protein